MKKSAGFTLIELVVVIIILGILAVTAAPKFINLQSDARASTLQGLKGALQGANALVFSKAAISGVESGDHKDLVIGGSSDLVDTRFGYLASDFDSLNIALDIDLATSGTDSEWLTTAVVNNTDAVATTAIAIYQQGSNYSSSDPTVSCHLLYTPATASGNSPSYQVVKDGC
ncbi:type II secretion system protein [Paraferrimonas sedimenticola]|uniref:MSHA pilin protein MshA n=1 Tax=Paraferrimonas sedimenticola TaxID=375674 RepID=A0AA37RXP7_9GAMM|nr:prepilin-type N-terminal cleavage/methylation domain-containing protein [Paraferrimonas sedimenticola]GLP97384.1 MSHA pilin protein MshA [Paraferrimonas sedimenticola]